jgi:hypothetical protein
MKVRRRAVDTSIHQEFHHSTKRNKPSAKIPGGVPGYKTPSDAPSPIYGGGGVSSACSLPSRGESGRAKDQEGPDTSVPGHPGADGAGCGCVRLSWKAKAEHGAETGRWKSNNGGQQESESVDRRCAGGNRGRSK